MHGTKRTQNKYRLAIKPGAKMWSEVTSARRLFISKDVKWNETAEGRRWHDVYTDAVQRCGGDSITDTIRTLCKRIATLTVVLEQRDQEYIRVPKMSRDQSQEYASLARTLTMLTKRAGLTGESKPDEEEDDTHMMDPLDYMKSRHTKKD